MNAHHQESYSHKYAKETVAGWFHQNINLRTDRGDSEVFSYDGIKWNPRTQSNKGIFMEYPILKNQTGEYLGIRPTWVTLPSLDPDDLKKHGLKVVCILDVAICNRDSVQSGLEIYYKHKVPPKKITLLKNLGITTYEIDSIWVLDQCHRPAHINKRLLTG